jgi:hypothetical protein
MTTNFHAKLGRLAAHMTLRTGYAEEARRRCDESPFTIDSYLAAAHRIASDDHRSFPDDFGSPMPEALAYGLRTEIDAWERLKGAIYLFRQAEPAPHELPAYAENVRRYLTCQLDLLDTEQETLTSCLTDQYVTRIAGIEARLDAVPL